MMECISLGIEFFLDDKLWGLIPNRESQLLQPQRYKKDGSIAPIERGSPKEELF